jgi:hypothetical protein
MIRPREIKRAGLAAGIEKTRNSCKTLARKHEGTTRTSGRPIKT